MNDTCITTICCFNAVAAATWRWWWWLQPAKAGLDIHSLPINLYRRSRFSNLHSIVRTPYVISQSVVHNQTFDPHPFDFWLSSLHSDITRLSTFPQQVCWTWLNELPNNSATATHHLCIKVPKHDKQSDAPNMFLMIWEGWCHDDAAKVTRNVQKRRYNCIPNHEAETSISNMRPGGSQGSESSYMMVSPWSLFSSFFFLLWFILNHS